MNSTDSSKLSKTFKMKKKIKLKLKIVNLKTLRNVFINHQSLISIIRSYLILFIILLKKLEIGD